MALIGTWVDNRIRQSALRNASAVSALYMESLISGPAQELARDSRLSHKAKLAISDLIEDTALGLTVMEIKIWLPDGTIVFDSQHQLIGTRPPPTYELLEAVAGRVTAELNDKEDAESEVQRNYGRPILEVYAPMYEKGTQRIIAVAEIYEDATNIMREFTIARQQSWIVVGSIAAAILSLLFVMVHRSSQLLIRQKAALQAKHQEKAELTRANEDLRARMAENHRKNAAVLERQLRRVGADLHDGPAQLMALALLRLHELVPTAMPNSDGAGCVPSVRAAMERALSEIRKISSGLSLPELDLLSPEQVIQLAVENHERLTHSKVEVSIGELPLWLPLPIKTCLFRCVQEGLSNAFRHAQGVGQFVSAVSTSDVVILVLRDAGAGFDRSPIDQQGKKLGISGMRHRVESLGGKFTISSRADAGTQVTIVLPREAAHE